MGSKYRERLALAISACDRDADGHIPSTRTVGEVVPPGAKTDAEPAPLA
jgi:hypothetical protein